MADRTDTRMAAWLAVFGKGLAMGAADAVPGVSGGTIALVTGIYERLIDALAGLDRRLVGDLATIHRPAGRGHLIRHLRQRDIPFLVVLALGVGTAVITLSRVVHAALVSLRAPTFAFFLGLIAAAALVLYRHIDLTTLPRLASAVVGFVIAALLAGASSSGVLPHTLPIVFVSGMIAITAMILPGISGAFILLLLGQYTYLTGVLTSLVDGLIASATGSRPAGLGGDIAVVASFGVGAAIGLVTVAHVIRRALDRYRQATLAFLVSLMVGSLRLPVLEIAAGVTRWTVAAAVGVGVATALGIAAVLLLDRWTSDLEYATG